MTKTYTAERTRELCDNLIKIIVVVIGVLIKAHDIHFLIPAIDPMRPIDFSEIWIDEF